jgi:hypothetical protein
LINFSAWRDSKMATNEKVMVPQENSSDSDRVVTKDEEGARKFSIGHISENREEDFLTRNGLNLRSFQRRKSHCPKHQVAAY